MAVEIFKFPNSSRVKSGKYDSEKKELTLEFSNNGVEYVYSAVAPQTWAAMKKATSAGQFINRNLNNHPYRRL